MNPPFFDFLIFFMVKIICEHGGEPRQRRLCGSYNAMSIFNSGNKGRVQDLLKLRFKMS